MGKIVRNKPTAERAAEIAAFGAAAEHPIEVIAPAAAATPPATNSPAKTTGPKNTLLRWDANQPLRDEVYSFAESERYSVHSVLMKAIELGLQELKKEAARSGPISPNIM